jgi:hypothetical protein
MLGFWIAVGIAAVVVLVFWLTFRSLRKWQQPPAGRDPESQQAEARLWQTKGMDQR